MQPFASDLSSRPSTKERSDCVGVERSRVCLCRKCRCREFYPGSVSGTALLVSISSRARGCEVRSFLLSQSATYCSGRTPRICMAETHQRDLSTSPQSPAPQDSSESVEMTVFGPRGRATRIKMLLAPALQKLNEQKPALIHNQFPKSHGRRSFRAFTSSCRTSWKPKPPPNCSSLKRPRGPCWPGCPRRSCPFGCPPRLPA
jgi:hypothetical protein